MGKGDEQMIEIRMHGRGGQGAVIATKILADALFLDGKQVQAFPQFGVERRGAPVTAFIRIAEENVPYIVRCNIYEPDHVVVLDPALLEVTNVLEGLKPGGWVLINTALPPESLPITGDFQVATVDASAIARKHGLGTKAAPIVNTAITGAFARITGLVSLNSLLTAIRESVPVKPEENANAAKEAYGAVNTTTGIRKVITAGQISGGEKKNEHRKVKSD